MKKNILAVLFDLDGVVVFTDKYHFLAWMKLSKEEGWEFNEKLNERLRGVSRSASLEIILGHNNVELTQEEKELLANRKNDYYIDFLKEINEVDIYPGVIPFIQNLRIKGVKTAICSSSKNARFVLEKLELMKYFDDVVTGDDIHKTKPDPEVFLMAAKSLGIHPMNCLVFEDAQAGIEGALAANMRCIGVGNGDATDLIEEYISCYDDINIEELLVSGYKSKLPRDPWRIIQKEMNPRRNAYWSSVFALSNGYIGIRGSYDETGTDMDTFNSQGMYINSAYCKELHHPKYVRYKGDSPYWHAMINLFDWTSINLYIEQEKFSLLTGRIIDYTRSLDMKKGLLELSVVWESPLGRQIELRTSRMVNMLHRHHAVIYYEVKAVNFTSEICIESWVKHWVPNRQFGERPVKLIKNSSQSGIHLFEYEIDTTGFKIGAAIGHKINGEQEGIGMAQYTNDDFRWIHRQTINQGDAIIFEKHGSFACSFDVPVDRINETVLFDVTNGIKKGYTRLEEEQQDFWEKFWRESDIAVEGNIEDQQALRYSIYQLRQNHPNHNKMSISATGLTGNNYNGHVFFDTELYILLFFL